MKSNSQNRGPLRKTLYLHIGPHKTGTSTIQRGLFLNRARFREAGICVPVAGTWDCERRGCNHAALVSPELLAPSTAPQGREALGEPYWRFVEELRRNRLSRVLVSSERFYWLEESSIGAFLQNLPPAYSVRVIFYFRSQDQWLQSFWAQMIKNATTGMSFSEFFDSAFAQDAALCDFNATLSRWERHVGQENIVLRRYAGAREASGSLFRDFLVACGVADAATFEEPEDSNVTPSLKTVEAMRAMVKLIRARRGPLDRLERAEALLEPVMEYARAQGWNEERLQVLSQDHVDRVRARVDAANADMFQRYGLVYGEADRPMPAGEPRVFDIAREIPASDWMGLLGHVLERRHRLECRLAAASPQARRRRRVFRWPFRAGRLDQWLKSWRAARPRSPATST